MAMEVVLIFLSVTFFLFIIILVPLFFQVWRNAKKMAMTLQALNEHLPTILKNLEEISTNVNQVSRTIGDHVEGLSFAVKQIRSAMGFTKDSDNSLKKGIAVPIIGALKTFSAIIKGIGVFIAVLRQPR
jgi:uncharacterized protein YoxC